MPVQTIIGDRLWDEILKAIVYAMPKQLFSLIKEVYGKEYPPDTPIRLLSTEHSTWEDSPQDSPSSTLMDISLLIADSDFYHIECQMENDKLMVIRMFSYDMHYAIEHCLSQDSSTGEITIRFPHSVVIYPDQNNNLPDKLRCRIIFQDKSEHIYQIPTVRIQSYTLEEIRKKHLYLFIPYLLLRLKPKINSKSHPFQQKELTTFMEEIIVILQDALTNGYLTRQECSDYTQLLVHASRHVFYHHPGYQKKVQSMTKPLIYLPSMQIMDLKASLAEKDSQLMANKTALAEMNSQLLADKAALAEKDSEIASLRAKLAAFISE